jgi:putative iron-regulated protein
MNKKISIFLFSVTALFFFGCKKNTSSTPAALTLAGTVLTSEANVVIAPTYTALAAASTLMYSAAATFSATPTQANLIACQNAWLAATAAYEITSATLFGPNGAIGADPASLINTYPVDTFGINSLVNSAAVFTPSYIDSIPPYLSGFHGMEFELYGINGDKTASEFTPQQLSYIAAVALNIQTVTDTLANEWSAAYSTSYYYSFVNAGAGSTVYPSQTAAFSDLVFAIANITETDGIYKLNGIYRNHSDILQESPFANNSVQDILNNLYGVQAIYLGKYNGVTGTGLTVFVSQSNVAMDIKLKADIATAISGVQGIKLPLSQEIYSNPGQIQTALNACDTLDDDLKTDLLLYMNQKTN